MILTVRALLLALAIVLAPTASSQLGAGAQGDPGSGDDKLAGLEWGTEAIATPAAAGIIAKAKEIDPAKGSKLEEDFNAGKLKFSSMKVPEGNSIYGYHDWNTIGVNGDVGATLQAIAALHEYTHLCYSHPDSTGHDSRANSICYGCTHANMTAYSWTQAKVIACNPPEEMSQAEQEELCKSLEDLKGQAQEQHDECPSESYLHCDKKPFADLANWDAPCPGCGG